MHRRIFFAGRAVAGLLFFFCTQSARANVVGSDAQNFSPTTSGLDFVTVQSSETLEPGVFNFGLFANYAQNALPYYGTTGGAKKNSSLTGGDFNLGLGVAHNLDAGISFPFIVNQKVSDDSSLGHYSSTGNTEVRLNTKFRLIGDAQRGLAFVASANFNRIAHNPYLGEGGGPIYNLEMAADTTLGPIAMAINLGRRWRKRGIPIQGAGIDPLADQWLASTAFSYLMNRISTKVVFEALAAIPQKNQLQSATDRQYTVLEADLGLKYDCNRHLSFHIGGGAGIQKGTSSPDFRVYTGVNLTFGKIKSDHSLQRDPYNQRDAYLQHETRSLREARSALRQKRAAALRKLQMQQQKNVQVQELQPKRISPLAETVDVPEPSREAQEVASPAPAKSSESVKDVKVYDRGNFNHIVLQAIEFVNNSRNLTPESDAYIRGDLLAALRELSHRRPIARIVIEGHTDSLGNEQYNLLLSQVRADIVSDLLRQFLDLKVPIEAVGRGSSEPIADNGNYQGRALNQRVEIKLIYRKSSR